MWQKKLAKYLIPRLFVAREEIRRGAVLHAVFPRALHMASPNYALVISSVSTHCVMHKPCEGVEHTLAN